MISTTQVTGLFEQYPGLIPLAIVLVAAIFEWVVPYPFFIRLSMLVKPFTILSRRVNGLGNSVYHQKISGILLTLIILAPVFVSLFAFREIVYNPNTEDLYISSLILLLILESRPSRALANRVYKLEKNGNHEEAKNLLGQFSLRVTTKLSSLGVAKATIENVVLKLFANFFVPVFYFVFFGIEVALFARLIVVLAMAFNQKLAYNQYFGRFCSSIQQLIYLLPALLVSLVIMLIPSKNKVQNNLQTLIKEWPAKASGLVLATITASLGIRVGGPRYYMLTLYRYPVLGSGKDPSLEEIPRAKRLISLAIWISIFIILALKATFILL